MSRDLVKRIVLALAIILGFIVLFRVGSSIANSSKKQKEVIFNITDVKLAKQKVPHILSVQGVLEGDPQVKIYPQVPGKFARNNVVEGQMVNQGDIVTYIDRDIVGATFELAPVKAPAAGMITKLYYIDKGDSVSPQMPVAEVANQDEIKVVFNVGQDDLLKVHKGQNALIYYVNDSAIAVSGTVASVPPVVDKDIMAGTVVVKAANKGRTLKIGMSVNVDILTEEKESFTVPERAVMLGEEGAYVYINKTGKASQVKVTTGFRINDMIEIEGPLADGDAVVVDGNFRLFDGAKVDNGASTINVKADNIALTTNVKADNTALTINTKATDKK
jgi:multidrug efflux pump subunit AcrA (membrane-fusion protein)